MANANSYLQHVFTSQDGEAYTVLQLIYKLLGQGGGGGGGDYDALEARVSDLEAALGDLQDAVEDIEDELEGVDLDDILNRLGALEEDVSDLQAALLGVSDELDAINGEEVNRGNHSRKGPVYQYHERPHQGRG